MKQRINLLVEAPKAKREVNGFSVVVGCVLLVLVGGFAGSWVLQEHASKKEAELAALNELSDQLPAEIAALETERKNLKPAETLLREQQVLEKRINNQRELAELVQLLDLKRYQGFSPFMYDMANVAGSGAWLTNIQIDLEAKTAELSGVSPQPENVPVLLSQLMQTSSFSVFRVDGFELSAADRVHLFHVNASIQESDLE